MNAEQELERWLARQRAEYRHAEIIRRIDSQVAETSELSGTLLGVHSNVQEIDDHLARLVAVADDALPAIVEHIALAAQRLGGMKAALVSPSETAAAELFRRGSSALTSATELSGIGSAELAAEWLDEAVSDLSRATEVYPYHAESWYLLGVALERQGSTEAAAQALSRCARLSATASPDFSAWTLLVAAGLYRRLTRVHDAAELLHKFVKPLERCAEIHLTLAVRHNEGDRLARIMQ